MIILIDAEILINKHDYSLISKKYLLSHQMNITSRKTTRNKLVTSTKVNDNNMCMFV